MHLAQTTNIGKYGTRDAHDVDRDAHDVPSFTGNVQVPFYFYDERALIRHLDLFDSDAHLWREATGGQEAPKPQRPNDPLTAWVALAYLGGLEAGGPVLPEELDREERLELAARVLSPEELLVVETIAVPSHFRQQQAASLEELVLYGRNYKDRLWSACWLILTGWTARSDCALREVTDEHPVGRLEHAVLDAYALSTGIDRKSDLFGWKRISADYESNLILHRLAICEMHYRLNGPPPYEHMKETVSIGKGWRPVVRLVPTDS
ncbi:MAG TPA: hypothetical protein VHW67_05695 [Solirubrobacteraceae bacterium]|jgi:hypothetical protein|nr:hypothetical protein [Solirubrobacteraceae bacterium]